jgi:hypothetical protein
MRHGPMRYERIGFRIDDRVFGLDYAVIQDHQEPKQLPLGGAISSYPKI